MKDDKRRRAILDAYAQTYGQGNPVPLTDIARQLGVNRDRVRETLMEEGLPYERFDGARGRQLRKQAAKEKLGELPPIERTGDEVRARRLREIRQAPGTGPRHQRPGSEYPPGAVIMTRCRMCGMRMVICPGTHGHFMRCDDGTVAWLCAPCDGSLPKGANTANFLNER